MIFNFAVRARDTALSMIRALFVASPVGWRALKRKQELSDVANAMVEAKPIDVEIVSREEQSKQRLIAQVVM